jgi:hypothetical protein
MLGPMTRLIAVLVPLLCVGCIYRGSGGARALLGPDGLGWLAGGTLGFGLGSNHERGFEVTASAFARPDLVAVRGGNAYSIYPASSAQPLGVRFGVEPGVEIADGQVAFAPALSAALLVLLGSDDACDSSTRIFLELGTQASYSFLDPRGGASVAITAAIEVNAFRDQGLMMPPPRCPTGPNPGR